MIPPPDTIEIEGLGPTTSAWFRSTFGEPTLAQNLAWPAIAARKNALLVAPTGSGKTLAAFLACLDYLWANPGTRPKTRILYISPLKALNNDVYRNLQRPLAGILETAEDLGTPLRPLTLGLRTGDTPQAERQRMLRKPPEILITTPESLHLLLTSRARETLAEVEFVIVDEIHALCSNKRGVFLSLLLERLQGIVPSEFVRIGLSATQRPLEEVARYLGGLRKENGRNGITRWIPRPVEILNAGMRKNLDLEVSLPRLAGDLGPKPGETIWPAIQDRLREWILGHNSTIVFANNRRVVEKLSTQLNESASAESIADEDVTPLARAHHGSLSLEERRATETALKAGELRAVVATASLELGIDMGAVDLVCQVGSPGGVARGLQRVGRAGHIVGQVSKGRILARTPSELLESAAVAHEMVAGRVEVLRVPQNCLDILAQQLVACVASGPCEVTKLYDLVRSSYPYRDLPAAAFESVLKLISGRFPSATFRDLHARVSWDRLSNTLMPLPGTSRSALSGGGTIPDTGQYPLYLGEKGPKLGELDEEFVLEQRPGQTFVLGTSTWKIESIDPQKVVVSAAGGQAALMPFWRGESVPRTFELGQAVGALTRAMAERVDEDEASATAWLGREYHVAEQSARSLLGYVRRQKRLAGVVPDDRTILVEAFRDPAGEVGLAILSPFGGRLHRALDLAIRGHFRERFGFLPATLHADDGILIRLPRADSLPFDILSELTPQRAEDLIRSELGESAIFGLRFRQNAGRALLLPRPDPAKRTPLWLQRLRAKDLLQVVRNYPDFPIVVETYRECLDDDLDLPRLREVLQEIQDGAIQVAMRDGEVASPFTSTLIFKFTTQYLYQWDEPKTPDSRANRKGEVDAALLDSLLESDAIGRVESRLRGIGRPPRTTEEMAETLRQLGDLTAEELEGPMAAQVAELAASGRVIAIELQGTARPQRYILGEEADLYGRAFQGKEPEPMATVVRRYLRSHALVGLGDLIGRYPLSPAEATELLERWAEDGTLVPVEVGGAKWADRGNLDEVRRLSLAIRRKESVAVAPEVFADFVARRQHIHPTTRREGFEAFRQMLERLEGYAATAELWESEILPRRLLSYKSAWLDEALLGGDWVWRARSESERGDPRAAFLSRGFVGGFPMVEAEGDPLSDAAAKTLAQLEGRGAWYVADLAQAVGLSPSNVRFALRDLQNRGLVSNDRFDALRPAGERMLEALAEAGSASASRGLLRSTRAPRTVGGQPEGRWSAFRLTDQADPETRALAWASALLDRYGVLCRETAGQDPWAPPWRELYPWLDRAELRGDVRRGYLVEGLSGVQYATEETITELSRLAGHRDESPTPFLVSTLDPACLYGSGAPFDIPLLEGGTARLNRSASNWVVMLGGRPVLIVEGQGKRLTGLASASDAELQAAVALLPGLAGPSRRVLKVGTYNGAATLASPAVPWLAGAGFVRNPPGMAFYAGW